MTDTNPSVFIVDNDQAVRDSPADLVDSVRLSAETYTTAQEFLAGYTPICSGCLVLDICMPGMSGLELQDELARRNAVLPIIFITGHGDIPMAVQAMRQGAQDFIQKPFRDQDLLDSINRALETGASEYEKQLECNLADPLLMCGQVIPSGGSIMPKMNERLQEFGAMTKRLDIEEFLPT